MLTVILSLVFFVTSVAISLSVYIASIASVMKLYEVINHSWWLIWQYPILFGVVWLIAFVIHVVHRYVYLSKRLDK